MVIAYLLQGLTLGFSATIAPGPFQAYLLAQSLKNGWRRTLPAALAPLFSDGPIIALVLLLLTQTPNWMLRFVRLAGGLVLLYLAKRAYETFRQNNSVQLDPAPVKQSLLEATLMNILNPNPYIFWSLVAGPIFLEGWRQSASLGISFMAGFYGALIGGFAGFILIFATAGRLDPKISRALSLIAAVALFLFGLYQLWAGIRG